MLLSRVMQIEPQEIHIWSADLETSPFQENDDLLSADERERANRFHFPLHRQRFVAAHNLLRMIISYYTNTAPTAIEFSYEDKKKPYINHSPLKFNLSHSDHMAVFAFTLNHDVGVDIEKIQAEYREGIAERYFSPAENHALNELPKDQRVEVFYRIWSRKEAMIKAIGKGFSLGLSSFSVSINDDFEKIIIDNKSWSLLPLKLDSAYQSAVATNQSVKRISYWIFNDRSPSLSRVEEFQTPK